MQVALAVQAEYIVSLRDAISAASWESASSWASLADTLEAQGTPCHVIGGADVAAELDAKRAINQGTRLAASL